jgi:hypothetical protein
VGWASAGGAWKAPFGITRAASAKLGRSPSRQFSPSLPEVTVALGDLDTGAT